MGAGTRGGNLGFCGAVNLAVQKTGTPYVILLNNDTETDKYFVEWLLRGIKKSDHIFSCGAQMIDYKNHEILDNAGDDGAPCGNIPLKQHTFVRNTISSSSDSGKAFLNTL